VTHSIFLHRSKPPLSTSQTGVYSSLSFITIDDPAAEWSPEDQFKQEEES
jgi:hypothetical protein